MHVMPAIFHTPGVDDQHVRRGAESVGQREEIRDLIVCVFVCVSA